MGYNLTANRQRVTWIDSCKGLAMLLVVLGHVINGYQNTGIFSSYDGVMTPVYRWIYSFHMALYFVISGFVFYLAYGAKRIERKKRYNNQVINLVFVYFIFSIIQWIIKVVMSSAANESLTLMDLLLMPVIPMAPYWYLWVLVFYYLIFHWFLGKNISNKIMFAVTAAISIIGCFVPAWTRNSKNFPYYILFFWLGIYLAKTDFQILRKKWMLPVSLTISTIIAYLVFGQQIDIKSIPVANLAAALCTTFFILSFFALVFNNRKSGPLELIGKYSLEIYVTHCIITAGNRVILPKIGINNFHINVLVNFVLATAIPILCSFVLKRINLHKLIFRPVTWWSDRKESKQNLHR